jgi:hypothetical protein
MLEKIQCQSFKYPFKSLGQALLLCMPLLPKSGLGMGLYLYQTTHLLLVQN